MTEEGKKRHEKIMNHRQSFTENEFVLMNKICVKCGKVDHEEGWCPDCRKCWDCMNDTCLNVRLTQKTGRKNGL